MFVLTWGGAVAAPIPHSLDVATHAGLAIAATTPLDHGGDIVFSYGPLGFLKSYLTFYVWPARLALAYGVALHLAVSVSLVWAARRSFPLYVALPLALVAAMLLRGDLSAVGARMDAAVVVLAFIWCVAALDADSPDWTRRLVVLGAGPFAAIELLAKLNTGAIVLALAAITLIALPDRRWRNLAFFAGSFTVALAALWAVSGQGIGDVEPYVTGARDLITGYSTSAYLDWPSRDYDFYLAPLTMIAIGAMAWFATRDWVAARRRALVAMLAVVGFTAVKAGFVGHDVHHMTIFYSTMVGIAFAFAFRPRRLAGMVPAAVGIAALAGAALTANFTGYPMANPITNVGDALTTAETFLVPGRLEDEITRSRTEIAASYGIEPEAIELLGEGDVHVDPSEATAAWALDLDWDPIPVFQSYAAWTPELDDRNAEAVADPAGPSRILRAETNPLGRYPGFESPAAAVAMLCNFESLSVAEGWQVLGRVADRCGPEEPLETIEADAGEPIPVPEAGPGELLLARVEGLEAAGAERAIAAAYRSRPRTVVFDAGSQYTLTGATASQGLLLRAPAAADYPAPFALAPNSETITFLRKGEPFDAELEIEFSTVPISGAGSAPAEERGAQAG